MTMMAVAAKTAAAKKPDLVEDRQIKEGKEDFNEILGAMLLNFVPPTDPQQVGVSESSTQQISESDILSVSGGYHKSWPLGKLNIPEVSDMQGGGILEGTMKDLVLDETTLLASKSQGTPAMLQALEKKGQVHEMAHHIQSDPSANIALKDVEAVLMKKESQDFLGDPTNDTLMRFGDGADVEQSADFEQELAQIHDQGPIGSVRAQSGPPEGVDGPKTLHPIKPGDVKAFSDVVVQEVQSMSEGEVDTIRVRLTPEKFGEMEVVLKMDQGKITGKIFVENLEAKSAFVEKLGEMNKSLSFVNATIFGVDVGFGNGGEAKQESTLNHSYESNPAFMEDKPEEGSIMKNFGVKTPLRGINMLA